MPCPKGKKLEAGHRQLRDLESLSVPSGLLDSMDNILDSLVIKLSEEVKGCDHLVIVEGFIRLLAKQENGLEHVNRVPAQNDFKNALLLRVILGFFYFVLIISIAVTEVSVFTRVLPTFTSVILAGFQGNILGGRYQHLALGLLVLSHHYQGSGCRCAAVICGVT